MQSSGGLSSPEALRGPAALLSGPAGGIVAGAAIATQLSVERLVTLDMGGTSTDVSVVPLGQELMLEAEMAGITVRSPMVDIRTVAAGGSSICSFDGHALTVGPESVGSSPGPLCFGRPDAVQLSLTDVDLLLGRIVPITFPIQLDIERARAGAERVLLAVRAARHSMSLRELLLGFRAIAAAHMAEAIRQVTVDRGLDPRHLPLLVFGGAAGQHACAVARALDVEKIVVHRHASVLSALGIGLAEETAIESSDAAQRELGFLLPEQVEQEFSNAEDRVAQRLKVARAAPGLHFERSVLLGYRGTTSALAVSWGPEAAMLAEFERAHERLFGFLRPRAPVLAQSLRVLGRRAHARSDARTLPPTVPVILDAGTEATAPLVQLAAPRWCTRLWSSPLGRRDEHHLARA